MNVLFVVSKIGTWLYWHQGIASLAAVVKQAGHTVELLELTNAIEKDARNALDEFQPDIIAATANSHQFNDIIHLLRCVKSLNPSVYTVIGGVHVTVDQDALAQMQGIDAICRGEGEEPLIEVIRHRVNGKHHPIIPNIAYPKEPETYSIPCTYYVKDLNTLPMAERSLFSCYRTADRTVQLPFGVRFLFLRGCPYLCSYCCNQGLRAQFPKGGSYVRWMKPENAIHEIEAVSSEYRFNHYIIDDDIFTLHKKWVLSFCQKYPEHLKKKTFEANARVETIDRDVLIALKECGCRLLKIGVESGDEEIRKKVLNRNISDEMILDVVDQARQVGIAIHTFNMLGIPGETRRALWKTVKLNQRIKPEKLQATIFYPYRNTPLGTYCLEKGMVEGLEDSYFKKSIIRHDRLSRYEIEFMARFFQLLVYSSYSFKKTICELYFVIGRLIKGSVALLSRTLCKKRKL